MQFSNKIAACALVVTASTAGYALARGGGIETQRISTIEAEVAWLGSTLRKHAEYHPIVNSLAAKAKKKKKLVAGVEASFSNLSKRQGSEEIRSSVRDERMAVLIEGFTVSQNKLASAIDNQSGILARLSGDMGRLDERLKTLER